MTTTSKRWRQKKNDFCKALVLRKIVAPLLVLMGLQVSLWRSSSYVPVCCCLLLLVYLILIISGVISPLYTFTGQRWPFFLYTTNVHHGVIATVNIFVQYQWLQMTFLFHRFGRQMFTLFLLGLVFGPPFSHSNSSSDSVHLLGSSAAPVLRTDFFGG